MRASLNLRRRVNAIAVVLGAAECPETLKHVGEFVPLDAFLLAVELIGDERMNAVAPDPIDFPSVRLGCMK